ncbi:hypothetical protein RJ641_021742, partial [Dillenia turbinata]
QGGSKGKKANSKTQNSNQNSNNREAGGWQGEIEEGQKINSMLLLCFILDLRTLPPSQLTGLKQVSIAYSPTRTNFSLRDFHRAVNGLPTYGFLPEALENDSASFCCQDMKFSSVLNDGVLYTWGGNDIIKKVIVISPCLPHNLDSSSEKTIMDAAENCISIEFVFLEPQHSNLCDLSATGDTFIEQITRLDNCSFQTYIPDVTDVQVLCGLVKRWLQELKDGIGEPLRACFTFQSNPAGSMNQMFCNLVATVSEIPDEFSACQSCMCHGIPLDDAVCYKMNLHSCLVTSNDLGTSDGLGNCLKVGEQTIPCLPSFWSCLNLQQVSLPIDFNIIRRTNLGTLSESALIGTAYIVAPTMCHEMEASSDGIVKTDLNTSHRFCMTFSVNTCLLLLPFSADRVCAFPVFQGLCRALNKLGQGMICYSIFNTSTLRETAFRCYYRLAGLEEILPSPEHNIT